MCETKREGFQSVHLQAISEEFEDNSSRNQCVLNETLKANGKEGNCLEMYDLELQSILAYNTFYVK